jgi:hypothetical protein
MIDCRLFGLQRTEKGEESHWGLNFRGQPMTCSISGDRILFQTTSEKLPDFLRLLLD